MNERQTPLRTGLGATTTAREVLAGHDLSTKLAVVTGGHFGIGLETSKVLASAGATVVVLTRSPDKARETLAGVPRVEIVELDLADPISVDHGAAKILASKRPIHFLINNAGIMAVPFARDRRGFESQLGTNHVGHFQLTARLWPALVAAEGARVVALTSRGHMRSPFDFEDPSYEKRDYDKWKAYGQSKTANALFALALDARGERHGVHAFSVHPGAIFETGLTRSLSGEERAATLARFKNTTKTIEQGAATTIWAIVTRALDDRGGVYCEDCDISEKVDGDSQAFRGVRPWAIDREAAERLFALTERWTETRIV